MTVVDVEDGGKWQVKYDDELTCLGLIGKATFRKDWIGKFDRTKGNISDMFEFRCL